MGLRLGNEFPRVSSLGGVLQAIPKSFLFFGETFSFLLVNFL